MAQLQLGLLSLWNVLLGLPISFSLNNHAFVVGASKLWRSLPEAIRIERFTFFYIIIVRMFYDFIREPTVER